MKRATRLIQIIQILRRQRGPVTADDIAEELEVTVRTIYRDMAALQANRVPVVGEAGVGYVLQAGYDLPPLMFTPRELEALMLGARLVETRGDADLVRGAEEAIAKISTVIPAEMRPILLDSTLFAPNFKDHKSENVDVETICICIRKQFKLHIAYSDENRTASERTIWPIGIGYLEAVRLVLAWCELRQDFRHFRTDRISTMDVLEERYVERRAVLIKKWRDKENGTAS
jgi:predicted DNA-binding transcriptional regulator YafY